MPPGTKVLTRVEDEMRIGGSPCPKRRCESHTPAHPGP